MLIISRFSSEANSVMSSPFMSSSFVGSAVSNVVMNSEFFMFWVSESPHPRKDPMNAAAKKRILNKMTVDFLIFSI